jgi:hypothetical protein
MSLQEFIFWKMDGDAYLVNHSRYWSEFDGHFGSAVNQGLLANLLAQKKYETQTIPANIQDQVYQQFEGHLRQGPITINYDAYQKRVAHDFAYLTQEEFEGWLADIRVASLPPKHHETTGPISEDEAAKSPSDSAEKKSSWFTWFRVV